MEAFFRTHRYLIKHVNAPVRRALMDEIDWNDRLIGIKGCRGVGKTTFLLQYAKENFDIESNECLYINLNNFYFAECSLLEFAERFYAQGGHTLIIDQTYKYENWSKELRACYEMFSDLHIIFSGSTVMRLVDENEDLRDVVKSYNLRGFSFREYLNLQAGADFPIYTIEDIKNNHQEIAKSITQKVKPLWYFPDYLHHGFYPFFLENRNYSENLLKTMNMMLEVDILIIKQIELKYLSKIRKLLHILMNTTPCSLNVSQLSEEIDTSRATIMNYIKYLKDARLLNLLYTAGNSFPKKPNQVYMQNTNLMYAISTRTADMKNVSETFFYNALHARHSVNTSERNVDFVINGEDTFNVYTNANEKNKSIADYNAINEIEVGENNNIPLWLFGFLY